MMIAKIVGTAVALAKHDALDSTKILLVSPANVTGEITGDPFLAVDLVGSGEGELVIISRGSSARLATDYRTHRWMPRLSASSTHSSTKVKPNSERNKA